MWIVLIIWIVFFCFLLPDLMFPLLGIMIGGGILLFVIKIVIEGIKDKKERRQSDQRIAETITSSEPKVDSVLTPSLPENAYAGTSVFDAPQFSPIRIDVKGIWDEERLRIQKGFELENILIDGIRHKIAVIDDLDCAEYAIAKLEKSQYPFSWNRSITSEIRGDILLIDYRLPSLDEIPDFAEIEYKKEQPICVVPNGKRVATVWTDISYKIVIRSLYELFTSPTLADINSISFNGIVRSLDLATGNETEKCILSVIAKKADFEELDLSRIDAKQCFKRFKGISAHDLSTLTPIPPLMVMKKEDKRFIDSYDVISDIKTGENLAAMDWRDFENLIRELFEKEFSADGSEVRITRTSKDGGVDAVVFDPDPIRGGKIIIQAKRYTNVVGVSAVRDLYGTVMNEGATKGILVTTSDYGADSYNFIKDKPLTLLNGANLLHLLGKHGCEAHINLIEAKKLLNALGDE